MKVLKQKVIMELINFCIIYLMWCIIHNLTIYIYYDFCIPKSIMSIIYTPFYIETPYCKILHWIHNTSIKGISTINYTIITWSTNYIIKNLLIKK